VLSRTGVRHAAILLVALDAETGGRLFRSLPEDDMDRLSREITSLGIVEKDEMLTVLEEFKDSAMLNQMLREGGYDSAIQLIRNSLPAEKASRLIRQLESQRRTSPFHFLEHTETEVMAAFLRDEHPQTIALVLSHLAPVQAAEVLTSLSSDRQVDIVRRIATLGPTSPETIQRVEAGLRTHLASIAFAESEQVGGVKAVSEILEVLDRNTERAILAAIERENVELAEEIRRRLFDFEDLVLVDRRGLQNVLEVVDYATLALALRLASEELRDGVFARMSKRAVEIVREEIRSMGPVRIADVEAAQAEIVEVVRRLEESGDVVIQGHGGENPLAV